ncbi:diguanylate cyclase [Acidovorax sp. Be4]|uniref:Diguanylate cyclase n=1 Tax=Acidovorax bellezanensis TaxID=2976702 RepID=A0ABT2PMU2_9BURK|nr:LapD/MoxY N-terminal periplasmic domain-containing protein [Acidovorax sp. Be4]MCT9811768.1 diguanylate cyclase [Acidovorax sp. Be4]
MSLLKQLLLSVTLAILVILFGTLALSIESARQYLDGQLQSESENAASSLALSLSQSANQDPVIRELLMLALFDSGRFKSIEFTAPDGTSLFSRRQAEGKGQPGLAPAWFTRWLPLAPAQTVREVSDGWRQVGRLSIQVDSGYANDALWRSSSRMALLVLTAGAVWALFVVGLLNWFRRVLRDEISAQVRNIGSREGTEGLGPQPTKAPVDELTVVVRAIRDTRERVRATDQEQTARIESLELETNCDAVTGLPNRKYFVHELGRVLHGELGNAAAHGQVLLFRLHDLPGLNAGMTRTSVDQWLVLVGQRVLAVLVEQGQTTAQVARLNGSEFAVLLPGLLGPQAMQVVQQLRQALQALRMPLADGRCSRWSYALTDYSPSCRVSEVLTRLDQALMGGTGHDEVEFLANEGHKTLRSAVSQSQWQQLLSTALAAPDSLSLAVYRHVYAGSEGEHVLNEALLVLHAAEENALAGSLFMPVAVRLGLSAAFDLRAVALGLQWLRQHPDERLVLRVSLPSLAHADFLGQLQEVMHSDASDLVLPRLSLELDAHGLVAYPLEMRACCAAVAQAGASTGLRRLDQEPKALALLHTLALAYVKWGTHSNEEGLESPGGRYLLEAVVHTTQALGLRLYVTDDADGQEVALLRSQGAYVLVAQPSSAA